MFDESSTEWLVENNRRLNEESVTLLLIKTPRLSVTLTAHIDPSGRLVLSGHDLGPTVAEFWPDDEYEYWLKVEATHLAAINSGLWEELERDGVPPTDTSVLELLKESFEASLFDNDSEFRAWLNDRQIPSEFSSWT
ncbi:MAG TPA: hypothetical protein VLB85_13300 [Acidimicrobiia bacterium]|nr:hypothetical protein [Acidimicrobiia bacterium]